MAAALFVFGNFPVTYPVVIGPVTMIGPCAVALAYARSVLPALGATALADSAAELARTRPAGMHPGRLQLGGDVLDVWPRSCRVVTGS